MTATIDPTADVMTLINVFTVKPEHQQRLVELLEEATENTMKRQRGFVSANIHKSADGKRVVNYAQWKSKADFEAMQTIPQASGHMKAASAIAEFDPIVCVVTSSHTV